MTTARNEFVPQGEAGWFHLIHRCVRRAFLCGQDALTGRSFDHRRAWVRDRLVELSGIFAIDVYSFAVMSNHYHTVVYVDIELLKHWSDEDVAQRWLRLCPPRAAREDGTVDVDSPAFQGSVAAILADPERVATRKKWGQTRMALR